MTNILLIIYLNRVTRRGPVFLLKFYILFFVDVNLFKIFIDTLICTNDTLCRASLQIGRPQKPFQKKSKNVRPIDEFPSAPDPPLTPPQFVRISITRCNNATSPLPCRTLPSIDAVLASSFVSVAVRLRDGLTSPRTRFASFRRFFARGLQLSSNIWFSRSVVSRYGPLDFTPPVEDAYVSSLRFDETFLNADEANSRTTRHYVRFYLRAGPTEEVLIVRTPSILTIFGLKILND
jgi:hypothetical protein